jgi:anaerobic selenocysteine-containing dehydrogenase
VVVPITGALPGVGGAHATDSAATDTGPDLRMESADPGGSAEHMEGVPRQPGSAGSVAANLLPEEAVPDEAPPADGEHGAEAEGADTSASAGRPAVLRRTPGSGSPVPAVDGYSLRLVATRKLYDRGATTQRSPSLAPLAPDTVLRLHPHDFDRVGVQPGTSVTMSSEHGSVHVPVVPDDGVPRGTAHVHVNQPGAEVSAVIDASAQVIDVRVVP